MDKPEYVPEKNSKRLSTKQKEELIYILTRECNGNWIASIIDNSNIKAATGYETAVQTWIDTYEGNNKIQYDKKRISCYAGLYKIIESKIMYKR